MSGEVGTPDRSVAKPLRGDVQGLRAVAVLSVVLGHAGLLGISGGYVGVDVFFVISGFLITGLLLAAHDQGQVHLLEFYAKRARRILPAATLVLLTTAVASAALLTPVRAADALRDSVWASIFLANVKFARDGTDYFSADEPPSVFQHYWSLAVEEQFYLVWPVVLAIVLLGFSWHRQRPAARRTRSLPILLVLVIVVSLVYSVRQTAHSPTAAYFSTPARAWELALGALVATQTGRIATLPKTLRATSSWLGLGAIVTAVTVFDQTTTFPGVAAVLPVAGAALVVAGGVGQPSWGAARLLSRQPLRWFGDISYSLYLWHWPFLQIPARYVGHELAGTIRLLLVGAAVIVSAFCYALIENPFRRSRALSQTPRRSLTLWPASLLVVLLVGQVGAQAVTPAFATHPLTTLPEGAVRTAAKEVLQGTLVPRALNPSLDRLRKDLFEAGSGCIANDAQVRSRVCAVGDATSSHMLLLIGDSHASMWLPALDLIGKRSHWSIRYLIKNACTPMDVSLRHDLEGVGRDCNQWRKWTLDQVTALHPQVVLVGSRTYSNLADQFGDPVLPERLLATWSAGVARTVRTLSPRRQPVLMLGDPQPMDINPLDCLGRPSGRLRACSPNLSKKIHRQLNDGTKAATETVGGAFIDVDPWFCWRGICPMVIDHTIVFRDREHITSTYAARLAPALAQSLSPWVD